MNRPSKAATVQKTCDNNNPLSPRCSTSATQKPTITMHFSSRQIRSAHSAAIPVERSLDVALVPSADSSPRSRLDSKRAKLLLQQAQETHVVVGRRSCQSDAQAAFTPGRSLVLISVGDCSDLRVTVRLQGSGQLKDAMTSTGRDPKTFRPVA